MHYAMQKGRVNITKLLYDKDAKLMDKAADSTGDTPVHILIRKGDQLKKQQARVTFGSAKYDHIRDFLIGKEFQGVNDEVADATLKDSLG
ncbi:hypothetical protein QBC36DRAFT_302791 [Triangularia setosa]|uniref:Uncharacterized protein n=1 Tax=Triangularia setosa TaxID=2587417 RepID=A0AAN6W326_9PEZI|nr:hypothetical protein QBC36DRAFT_302791 [Podospora setosa]